MRPGRVLFDGRYIQDRYHGIGRYAFHLLDELAARLPETPFHVARDPALPETRFDWTRLGARPNVTFADLSAPPFGAREQVALPRAWLAAHPHLYHSPYFALPWLWPGQALVTVHDCIFERDARYMPRRWARAYYRLLMTVSLRRARAVLVPSAATAADVRRFYGVPERKMRVTPEAADHAFRPLTRDAALEAVRAQYGLPEVFILAVGARRPHKNFARLVDAVGAVDGLALAFIGGHDARFADDVAPAAARIGPRVRFLGHVPEGDLPAIYNLATAVACPSHVEGFGLPALEAMACGAPVICSDIPVFREVAADAAVFAAPDDTAAWTAALRRVAADPDFRAGLHGAGLRRSRDFTWGRAAEAVIPIYRKLGAATP
jgi:glycosyltransferase involved in cell wall biosynthesis